MRIVLVLSSFPTQSGDEPAFPASWYLAKSLLANGHDLLVLTMHSAATNHLGSTVTEVDGIRVFCSSFDASKYSSFDEAPFLATYAHYAARAVDLFNNSAEIVDEFAPDLIECQEFNGLGFFFAAEHKYPLVVRCYGTLSQLVRSGDIGDWPLPDTEMIEALELATIAEADAVVSICHDLAGRLSGLTSRPVDDFSIIRTPFVKSADSAVKTSFEQHGNFPKLFFWGRVERQKGVDLLVESLPQILAAFPKAELIVGGSQPTEFNCARPYAETMRDRLKEMGLLEKVRFTGFLSRAQIQQLIIETDICVFPSRYETACYSLLEAQSCGACCVASGVGGLPEYQENNQTVLLVEPNSASALASGVIALAADQQFREKLSQGGLENVPRVCNPNTTLRLSLAVYSKAIIEFKNKDRRRSNSFSLLAERIGRSIFGMNSDGYVSKKVQPWLASAYQSGFDDAMKLTQHQPPVTTMLRMIASRVKRKLIARSLND